MFKFNYLCEIAHAKNSFQISDTSLRLLYLISSLQIISLFLPNDGWLIWDYKDQYLLLAHYLCSAFTGTPLLVKNQMIGFSFALSIIITTILVFIFIYILFIRNSEKFAEFLQTLFLLFLNCLQLPIISLFVSQIVCGQNSLSYDCSLSAQRIVNVLGLVLFTFFISSTQYLFRCYSFMPFNMLQLKYSITLHIKYIFLVIVLFLTYLEDNTTNNYIELMILNCYLILEIKNYLIDKPSIPDINIFVFKLTICEEVMCILTSINVFTENQLLIEESLLIVTLIFLSISYVLSQPLLDSFKDKNIFNLTQQLHQYSIQISINLNTQIYLKYLNLLNEHHLECQQDCYLLKKQIPIHKQGRKVIYCILTNQLKVQKYSIESLQLHYLTYLGYLCKKPLVGFVELKKYEISHSSQHSQFYKLMKTRINLELSILINDQQAKIRQGFNQQQSLNNEKQLEVDQIVNSFQLQDKYLIKIIELLNLKNGLWSTQIKGYNSIWELEEQALALSIKQLNLKSQLEVDLNLDLDQIEHVPLNMNIVSIKLASLYFSVISNDYYSTQLCEQAISEIVSIEHTLSSDLITNIKLVEDKVAIIQLSMVKKRGTICNKKDFAHFFGFLPEQFEAILHINQLMPQYMADIHDYLLLDYLQSAKSQFLNEYNQVYSIDGSGFLKAMQLKIENIFDCQDDFQLIGCLSQVKLNQDYIIFSEDGHLLGTSKDFFDTVIKQYTQNLDVTQFIQQSYIFMFIPNFVSIIREVLSKSKTENYSNQLHESTTLFAPLDFRSLIKLFSDHLFRFKSNMQRMATEFTSIDAEKMMISYLAEGSSKTGASIYKRIETHLADTSYQEAINSFINEIDIKQVQRYQIKFKIYSQTVGKKQYQKTFFVLEIFELTKRDLLNYGETSFQLQTLSASIYNNQQFGSTLPQETISDRFTVNNIEIKEIIPPHYHQISVSMNKNVLDFLPDSGRESYSYGPLSQRAHFLSPTAKQIQMEELIEQEFPDMFIQQDLEMDPDFAASQKQEKSSSNVEQKISNNVLAILKQNKTKKGQNEQDHLEFEAQKSKSSGTSGTSGMTAIQIIKKFQQRKELISSLKILTLINVLCLAILIAYMIVNLIIYNSNHSNLTDSLNQLSGPMDFNRYFCKIYSYAWGLLFNTLGIISSSDFLINSYLESLQQVSEVVFSEFATMYPIYLEVENEKLIQPISLDLIFQEDELVDFTYFQQFIQTTLQQIFVVNNSTKEDLSNLDNDDFINNLMLLNFNLDNIVILSVDLIKSLNTLLTKDIDNMIIQMQIIVSIEIVLFAIILFGQMYFWRQIETYIQQILLLLGRLQESTAQDMIYRVSYIKDCLQNIQGSNSWKKQNFHSLMYLTMTQQHSVRKTKNDEKTNNQKRNQSVVLSSRIYRTEIDLVKQGILITFTYLIIFAYLIGGYFLYYDQTISIKPTQELYQDFLRFSTQFDIVAVSALVIKTQGLMFKQFVNNGIYTQEQNSVFQSTRKGMLEQFIDLESTYNQNISQIYDNIIASNRIDSTKKTLLTNLYSEDLCISVSATIKFCNFGPDFAQKYGNFSELDDNREYLKDGIIGMVSRFEVLVDQIFGYEMDNRDFNTNLTELLAQISTKEFNNAVFQHFIDSTDATEYVLDIIGAVTVQIMNEDLSSLFFYYLIGGCSILFIYIIVYLIWIIKTNNRLIGIRLSLVNLPIEVITDQHTISQLKRMN